MTKIYSPVKGKIKQIEKVNDEVFAQKMTGDGIAVVPNEGIIYSPVSGEIKMFFPTKHAFAVESFDGTEILVHIGLETVNLEGDGFKALKNVGDKVEFGEAVAEFNKKKIEKMGYDTDIVVVNISPDKKVFNKQEEEKSVHVGDVLFLIE